MTHQEIVEALHQNVGKRTRITFVDGVVQSVEIDCVDEEGFLHSGPDGADPQDFWSRFDAVALVESTATSTA